MDAHDGWHISDDMEALAMCPFSELPEHLRVNVIDNDDGITVVTAEIDLEGGGIQVSYEINDFNTSSLFVPDDIAALFDQF